jgi:hypothetical protein
MRNMQMQQRVRPSRRAHLRAIAAVIGAFTLPGLGATAEVTLKDAACSALTGQTIAPVRISLPSGEAKIASATIMARVAASKNAQGQLVPETPAYCKVLGFIAPIDSTAPPINFQVNLPIAWNGKAIQYGGGGLNGVLVTGLAFLRDAPPNVPMPLAQGYVTLGTDSGHQDTAMPEVHAFGLNAEAVLNHGYASYKKVRDIAAEIARTAYSQEVSRFYFFGGSEGGREALMMAQRFPRDYDGIVSVVPAIDWVGMGAKHVHVGLLQRNGGWLSPGKLATLQKGVLAACDELDGLKDGVISNIWACSKYFDATVLRCEGGQNTGDTCLADPEIAVVKAIHGPHEYPFPLANGITSYPSWGYGGETQPGGLDAQIAGSKPPAFPPLPQSEQDQMWFYTNGVIRYFIAKDPNLDPSKFNPQDFVARIQELSATLDATNPDLSVFKQRGGKLIMRSNLADYSVSPFSTMNYYESVTKFMGKEAVEEFVRFYLSAGSSHGGPVFSGIDRTPVPSQTDLLSVLDAWVDRNQSPPRDKLIQTLHTNEAPFSVVASRPMCAYPGYPHYVGAGNPKSADSYECRKP